VCESAWVQKGGKVNLLWKEKKENHTRENQIPLIQENENVLLRWGSGGGVIRGREKIEVKKEKKGTGEKNHSKPVDFMSPGKKVGRGVMEPKKGGKGKNGRLYSKIEKGKPCFKQN